MIAKKVNCVVREKRWLTESVVRIRFEPSRKFSFQAGQFISVILPSLGRGQGHAKRCYSLASSAPTARDQGYELMVKIVPGGRGSEFLSALTVGDHFSAMAPFGEFQLRPSSFQRDICFVATGTGIAPFLAMLQELERNHYTGRITLLFGARHESELLVPVSVDRKRVEVVEAVSAPTAEWQGFKGRVTHFLEQLPASWRWFHTDFYICGNGDMTQEVVAHLLGARGVKSDHIFRENFSAKVQALPKVA